MRARVLVGLAAVAGLAAGCQPGEPRRLATVPAEGKVLYKGKPPVGARVVLLPVADESPDAVKPSGTVGDDGTFRLSTYPTADGRPDGAPPGEYRVSIRWTARRPAGDPDDEGSPPGPPGGIQPDRLGERYSDPKTSGLRVTVEAGKPIEPIQLK